MTEELLAGAVARCAAERNPIPARLARRDRALVLSDAAAHPASTTS